MSSLHVLILEDHEDDAALMLRELRREGYTPVWEWVQNESEYLARLQEHEFDLILADYSLPQFDALRALDVVRTSALDVPFIIVSGSISEEVAVHCMKQGAADYLLKDRLSRLGPAVTQALRAKQLRDEKRRAEQAEREEAELTAALARISQDLIAVLDTPRMLERLCGLTAEVLQGNSCCTLLWQPQKEEYSLAASWGYTPEQQEILRVLRVRQATIAPLITSLDREHVVELRTLLAQAQMSDAWLSQFAPGSILCLQLRRGQELLGLHLCGYTTREPLGSLRYRIAQGISQIASLALANAKLIEELARANNLKNDFLATMSHELRTPLNIIMGYTDLLIDGDLGPLTEDQRKSLYSVGHSARELLNLITATLDVSRMEAGRMPVETDTVDIEELIEEIQQETERDLRREGLSFRWRVESQLPIVFTDRIKLKVIIKNLLGNAIKFTPTGTVTVQATRCGDRVEMSVQDTGIGIAPETLPVIFDMFRQGDSSDTRLYGGVGLGLYIVRRLLDLLQGTVTVESTVGRGSTFTITIPLHPHKLTVIEQFAALSPAIRLGR